MRDVLGEWAVPERDRENEGKGLLLEPYNRTALPQGEGKMMVGEEHLRGDIVKSHTFITGTSFETPNFALAYAWSAASFFRKASSARSELAKLFATNPV